MNTNRLLLIAAFAALLVLSACATTLSKTSRVHLGGQSFLELGIPVGWELRVAFGPLGIVEKVRVFRNETEVMQIVPVQWSNQRSESSPRQGQLRNTALATLQERSKCKDLKVEQREFPLGVATYCAMTSNGGQIVGVWNNGEITTEFSFLEQRGRHNSELWQVIGSIRHFNLGKAA